MIFRKASSSFSISDKCERYISPLVVSMYLSAPSDIVSLRWPLCVRNLMYFFAIGELSPSFLMIPVFEAPLADSRRISKIMRVESRRCLKDE